jgi:hypothetical protein
MPNTINQAATNPQTVQSITGTTGMSRVQNAMFARTTAPSINHCIRFDNANRGNDKRINIATNQSAYPIRTWCNAIATHPAAAKIHSAATFRRSAVIRALNGPPFNSWHRADRLSMYQNA